MRILKTSEARMRGRAIKDTSCTGREATSTSELRRLSSDPELTKHPDPKFPLKFSDPDEVGDEEPIQFVVNSTAAPPRRVYPKFTDGQLRRSPKE
jgi:hypothetical protein